MWTIQSRWRLVSLLLIGLLFIAAGFNHFANPGFYLKITPDFIPWPRRMITISGVFEVLGGVGVLVPWLRRSAGWGLIVLLLAVLPVHVDMLVHVERFPDVPLWALVARLLLQPLLIVWVWWAAVSSKSLMRRRSMSQ